MRKTETMAHAPSVRRTRSLAMALAAAGVIGSSVLAGSVSPLRAESLTPGPINTQPVAPGAPVSGHPASFADLVEKVSPAVVSIRVVEEETVGASEMPDNPFPPGSPFEHFFDQLQPKGPDGKPMKRKAMAQGSGFIISPDGFIVTNNHVVEGGKEITVVFKDGTEETAKLIGRDPKTDLALVKVKPTKPLPYVQFSKKDTLRVGDWVVAVGNPFGLGGSVTAGIVSARGRDIGSGPYDDFIQIDAPINKGNSGGPTFDVDGNVVGVNTAIYSPSGGSVGIGFAIPAETVSSVIEQLKTHGKVVRGYLGVTIQPLDKDIASSLGLEADKGAIVAQVSPDSPAAKAGIKQGDVILKLGDEDMPDARAVSRHVAALQPGDKAVVTIWRDGKKQAVNVNIGTFPDNLDTASAAPADAAKPKTATSLGLSLQGGKDGVVIQNVDPNSDAADKGVQTGDVILNVDGKGAKAPADVVDAVAAAKKAAKKSVLLLIRTGGQQRFVALTLGDN
ncbi:MAG: Do family serine endopeptidase [Parvibaculaceae bacterium]|nr:Do family serine endopeptidase [Parvibaculaceae bacterium]